ncbi:hypothetical protein ACLQ18_09950 [Streptomyces sp. DT193]|uniref:hypothetical protein n=1 Tax=Streptomyces sp. DT193 TaxID=3393418 RepID=UPI003CF49AD8
MPMTGMVTEGRTEQSWIYKEFRSNVPPARQALAKALQEICRYLTPDKSSRNRVTQATAAAHLGCSESSLSRFLSGDTVPGLQLVESFYKQACADAGNRTLVSVSLEKLKDLHAAVLAERSKDCGHATEIEALSRQLKEANDECETLRQGVAELAGLRRDVAEQKAVIAKLKAARAGLRGRLAVQATSAPLPVPRRRGDRQRMRNDTSAARRLAEQAGELGRNGRPDVALTLLRQTTEALSPREMATLLLLLRQQQDDKLADNVIHIYGRDQNDQDVLHVTLALHEHGATEDAGAMLRAALR